MSLVSGPAGRRGGQPALPWNEDTGKWAEGSALDLALPLSASVSASSDPLNAPARSAHPGSMDTAAAASSGCGELTRELVAAFARDNTVMLTVADWKIFGTMGGCGGAGTGLCV